MNEKIYADTDSYIEKRNLLLKLNSVYGSMATQALTPNKRKDFIIVHDKASGNKIVVFVEQIATIRDYEICFNGDNYCNIKETLKDVIHLLHNKGYM